MGPRRNSHRLIGWWLLITDLGGRIGFLLLGIAIGVGTSVIGSLAHDVLTRTPGPLCVQRRHSRRQASMIPL